MSRPLPGGDHEECMVLPRDDIKEIRHRVANAVREAGETPWLVGYDVNAIQELVTTGSRPIIMRGASETVAEFDRKERGRCRNIFAGGGRGVSVVASRAEAERLVRMFPGDFRKVSVIGVMAAAAVPLEFGREGSSQRWLRHKLDLAKDAAPPPGGQLPERREGECVNCQRHQALATPNMRDGQEEFLCEFCTCMMRAGRRTNEMSRSLLDVAKSDPNRRFQRSVAAISADGNNLGAVFDNIDALDELAVASEAVGRLFLAAHEDALEAARVACKPMRHRNRAHRAGTGADDADAFHAVPLITGGDDIRVFVPASGLIAYIDTLAAEIERGAGKLGDLGGLLRPQTARALGQLGVGIGAVVMNDHYPARRLMEYAHDLERAAKKICGHGAARSAFEVEIVTNEQAVGFDSDTPRKETDGRPFDLDRLRWSKTRACAFGLQAIPSTQRQLLHMSDESSREEFDNLFRYQVARTPAWQAWYENHAEVDWRARDAVVNHRPGVGLLALAALLPEATR